MRVSYIVVDLDAKSETFMRRDVKALEHLGVDVNIYSLNPMQIIDKGGSLYRLIVFLKEFVLSLFGKPGFSSFASVLFNILFSKDTFLEKIKTILSLPSSMVISRRLITHPPDAVHVFWGHYPSLVILLSKRFMSSTVFSIFLGAYDLSKKLSVSKRASKQVDAIFTHAEENLETVVDFLGCSKSDVMVVRRGIDLTDYPFPESLSYDREMVFFSSGRLLPSKKFDNVIRAFNEIKKKYSSASLEIAGDGDDMSRLKGLVEELNLNNSVFFLGWLPEHEITTHLLRSKFFLFFSEKPGECIPNSLKEAMAAGCIPICTKITGVNEIIKSDNGYIIDYSVNGALACVQDALGSGMCSILSFRAARKIRNDYDVRNAMSIYIKIWERAKVGFSPEGD